MLEPFSLTTERLRLRWLRSWSAPFRFSTLPRFECRSLTGTQMATGVTANTRGSVTTSKG